MWGKEGIMKALYVAKRDPIGPQRLAHKRIAEVMSKPAVTIPIRATLDEALRKMVRMGLRHLAVVDDGGHCTGVLSDRAIAAIWATDYAALSHYGVASALDPDPAMVGVRDTVADAARVMGTCGIDAVAVVDDRGQPVGMVTGGDLVWLLAR
jgi:CBS domain-containing protein